MQEQKDILDCYNKTAEEYAQKFQHELEGKPLDRILLRAFGDQNKNRGRLIDLGCGPGHTTQFLHQCGCSNILGTDLSPEMVKVAQRSFPSLTFEPADMLSLQYSDQTFGSAIAFYAIVHFDYDEIEKALREVHRILQPNGELLFSFHVGNEIISLETFLEKEVKIQFQFFEVEKVKAIASKLGFEIIDILTRHPYPTEHPTERAYFWIKKGDDL